MADPLDAGDLPIGRPPTAFVYYAYDHSGDLLYVGLADDMTSRLAGHRRAGAPWLRDTARIRWERYATRSFAARVEQAAIRDLVPKFNVIGNWQRDVAASMGLRFVPDSLAWRRLSVAMRERRIAQRRTQRSIAHDACVGLRELRALEHAERERYTAQVLAGMERALCWREGSVEAVLTGGEPTPLTEDEVRQRVETEARRIFTVIAP